jgi:predicted DNA-binding protein (MmcQ/YjbR family)
VLRESYEAILPGYHMNKKHWNTVLLDGTLPLQLVRELIDHSYELVRPSASKK